MYAAVRAGHLDKARELEAHILPASQLIVAKASVPGVKYAMDLLGYRGAQPREPLLPPSDEQKKPFAT